MKILTIIYEFPPIGGGGGKVAEDICRGLSEQGHLVRGQTVHFPGLPKIENRYGYQIYRTFAFRRRADRCSIPEMAAFVLTNCLPTLRQIVTWKPDILHAHFAVPTGVLAWLMHFLTGTPYVLTIHAGEVPGVVPELNNIFRLLKPFTTQIWKRASAIITASNHVRRLALSAYKVDIVKIPNAVYIDESLRSERQPGAPTCLIFAGRFSIEKNPLLIIEVLARLRELNWELDMLVDGPLMKTIKERVAHYGLKDRIHLPGWVSNEVVDRKLSNSDVLFLPSYFEGLPIVGIKALAYGLAILGSDIPGMEDILINGINGFACPANNEESFVRALRFMLTSPEKLHEMKKASRNMAPKFDRRNIVGLYEEVLLDNLTHKEKIKR
jgi:glycosyltransferase involved in cell wall biosynthesis